MEIAVCATSKPLKRGMTQPSPCGRGDKEENKDEEEGNLSEARTGRGTTGNEEDAKGGQRTRLFLFPGSKYHKSTAEIKGKAACCE